MALDGATFQGWAWEAAGFSDRFQTYRPEKYLLNINNNILLCKVE